MGKIKRGILGGFQGKVANVIGGSWKGIAYMRSQPLSVANPKTAGQVAQRTSFSFAVAFAKLILSTVVKPLWDRFAQSMSGYNAFVSANVASFVDWTTTTWADIIISTGKMSATPIVSLVVTAGGNLIAVTWSQVLLDNFQQLTDKAYVVIVNEDLGEVYTLDIAATRDDEVGNCNAPEVLVAGHTFHAYLAFARSDGSIVSNTSYDTEVAS